MVLCYTQSIRLWQILPYSDPRALVPYQQNHDGHSSVCNVQASGSAESCDSSSQWWKHMTASGKIDFPSLASSSSLASSFLLDGG